MSKVTLPTFDESYQAAQLSAATPLQRFIANWEPAGGLKAENWRDELAALLWQEREQINCPDFETAVRVVAAHIHGQGKFYIEIGVDPKTKEVGWTFEPTEREHPSTN